MYNEVAQLRLLFIDKSYMGPESFQKLNFAGETNVLLKQNVR